MKSPLRIPSRSRSRWRRLVGCILVFWLVAPATPSPTLPPIRVALVEGLSGPFANAGEAVWRNVSWAAERVNGRGGVRLSDGLHPLRIDRYDSHGQVEEALAALRAVIDDGTRVVLQGNSSAVAAALVAAIDRHDAREPDARVVLLNYAAVDPALTNESCSAWHFRFDAHADMRMAALMSALRDDRRVHRVYLIGQDYSFGRGVLAEARRLLGRDRPGVRIVGDELHALGRVKDFAPYAAKIVASGADAVVTGNWATT